jgi:hypothetical protein
VKTSSLIHNLSITCLVVEEYFATKEEDQHIGFSLYRFESKAKAGDATENSLESCGKIQRNV